MPSADPLGRPGLFERLRARATATGDRPALRLLSHVADAMPVEEMTFADLYRHVAHAVGRFATLANDPIVALVVPNTPKGQAAFLAAEIAGIAVPINPLLPDQHVGHLLRSAGASILIVQDAEARAAALAAHRGILRHVFTLDQGDNALFGNIDDYRDHDRVGQPQELGRAVAAFHTGGTTGLPKLALHREQNQLVASLTCASRVGLGEGDVVLNPLPLFHVAGAICVGLASILSGSCQLLPTASGGRSPGFRDHFWSMVEHHGVTAIAGVPTIIAGAVATMPEDRPPALRVILVGGAPLAVAVERELSRRWDIDLVAVYGMTETAGFLTSRIAGEVYPFGCVGLPAPGVEIRVVRDPADATSQVPVGDQGHILASGSTIGPGYTDGGLNETLFNPGSWLITGDNGAMDAGGNLFLTGRAKDVIIRGGHNIDAALIEEIALRHPAVEAAAAVGAPDAYAGEIPYLYVQLKPAMSLDLGELEVQFRVDIEPPAVPKYIEVVDFMPITGAGKIYKPELRRRAAQRVLSVLLGDRSVPPPGWRVDEADGRLIVRFDPAHGEAIIPILEELSLGGQPVPS
ncbi:AMP-binding protein [Sphingomonas sp. UYAg733]